ncbi:MAG: DUF4136 domain-containing protein [Gammaproteobacteria bacterium]|nr:DUF4136 domain-containing protein [Gammaproteobacteria bacterium]
MAYFKFVVLIISISITSACSTLSVHYDYDTNKNFSTIRTYNWLPFPRDADIDELNKARFINAIDADLASKGLTKNSSQPDFEIATHVGKEDKVDISTWGYTYAPYTVYRGYGYRYPEASFGYSTGGINTYHYQEGTLILDFIDARTKKLFWRATAKDTINPASTPEKQTAKINNAVKTILENFPPKSTDIKN